MDGEIPSSLVRLRKPLNLKAMFKGGLSLCEVDCKPLAQTDEFDEDMTKPEVRKKLIEYTRFQPDSDFDDKSFSGLMPFEKMKKIMFDVTTDGKIMKQIKREGSGIVFSINPRVKIHYLRRAENQDVPYDVSYLRSELPESFELGAGNLIPGLGYAIGTMKAGEKAWFLLHHDYMFGKLSCGQRILKEASIFYEVTLGSFSKNLDILTTKRSENLTLERVELAETHLKKGEIRINQDKDIELAIDHFKVARSLIIDFHIKDKLGVLEKLLDRTFTNIAICHKQGDYQLARETALEKEEDHELTHEIGCQKRQFYESTCETTETAMLLNGSLAEKNKLKFAWGEALRQLGDHDASCFRLKEAQRMQPKNKDIAQELDDLDNLEKMMQEYNLEQWRLEHKMFQTDGAKKKKEPTVPDSFIKLLTKHIEEVKHDTTELMCLSSAMTGKERNVAKNIATSLGLKYSETSSAGEEAIVIRK